MIESDWPDVGLVRVEAEQCAQWSGLRDVVPLFTRQPYEDWCRLFRWACEGDEELDWKGAGFARCRPEEVGFVEARFEAITESVNTEFRAFLRRALTTQPEAAQQVIAIDGALAVSQDGTGHLCGFSAFV